MPHRAMAHVDQPGGNRHRGRRTNVKRHAEGHHGDDRKDAAAQIRLPIHSAALPHRSRRQSPHPATGRPQYRGAGPPSHTPTPAARRSAGLCRCSTPQCSAARTPGPLPSASPNIHTSMPPSRPVTKAMMGRNTATTGPNRAQVMAMLSMPVCGVDSRNEVAAARLAPWRRTDAVTGITPHEHNTSGTPNRVALKHRRHPSAAQVPFDPLRRDAHREQPRRQKTEQQGRRHLAQDRPAFSEDVDQYVSSRCQATSRASPDSRVCPRRWASSPLRPNANWPGRRLRVPR